MSQQPTPRSTNRGDRLRRAQSVCGGGKICPPDRATGLLEAVIQPGDRVCLEGDNQKQADFLSTALPAVDPAQGPRPAHGAVGARAAGAPRPVRARRGEAARLRLFGPAVARSSRMLFGGKHRARRGPHLSRAVRPLLHRSHAARGADRALSAPTATATSTPGRTPRTRRPSSRRPPSRTASSIAQVNEIVDKVPRVDIPGDRVHFVVKADKPLFVEPLFTRDPARSPSSRS